MNWKVVGASCKLKSCKGVFGVQLAWSEDSTVLTTETSQESNFVNVILFLMFAFRLSEKFRDVVWRGVAKIHFASGLLCGDSCKIEYARCPKFPTTFQFTLLLLVVLPVVAYD